MAEEIDDTGFYREDFSTDSEWEVFNAQLSGIFEQWELSTGDWGIELQKDELYRCQWEVQEQMLELLQKEVVVKYYSAKLKSSEETSEPAEGEPTAMHKDLMSVLNTFAPSLSKPNSDLHTLARVFGLRRFVIIRPFKHCLTNTSEFTFFLSSAAVVAAEVHSSVPIFVQVHDFSWKFYLGVGMAPGLRTNFDVVAMEKSPPEFRHLSGLLNIFKEKLPAHYVKPTTVSVCNTYNLDTVNVRIPMNIPFAKSPADELANYEVLLSFSQFTALPSGYFPDSCVDLYVTYSWPEIAENIVIDSPLRSDFVPSKAPFRSLHQEVHATSYLSSCVLDYSKLYDATQLVEYYVGRNFSGAVADIGNPLEKLTKPRVTQLRSQHGNRDYVATLKKTPQKRLPGPMTESELEQMLIYLMPHLHPDTALFPYPNKNDKREVSA